jgi:sulfur carrier protein ThiS
MKINFKLFALLQDYLPAEAKRTNSLSIDVTETTTVMEVVERFSLPLKMVHLVLIDGHYVAPGERASRTFKEGETLSIWPPVAGG